MSTSTAKISSYPLTFTPEGRVTMAGGHSDWWPKGTRELGVNVVTADADAMREFMQATQGTQLFKDLSAAVISTGGNHESMRVTESEMGRRTFAEKGSDWLGKATLADVRAALDNGDHERADRVKRLADVVRAKLPAAVDIRRRQEWADDGEDVNVERVLAGDYERAFRRTRKRHVSGSPTVSLYVAWCFSAGESATSIEWRTATALAIVDVLTEAGYSVALTLVGSIMARRDPKDFAVYMLPVKDALDPVNMPMLAALTSEYTYRRVGISYGALAVRNCGYGSGNVVETGPLLDDYMAQGIVPPHSLMVPVGTGEASAVEAATAILNTLNREALAHVE